jgi:hypothetical protein
MATTSTWMRGPVRARVGGVCATAATESSATVLSILKRMTEVGGSDRRSYRGMSDEALSLLVSLSASPSRRRLALVEPLQDIGRVSTDELGQLPI